MHSNSCSKLLSRWISNTGNSHSPALHNHFLRHNRLNPNGSQHPCSLLAPQTWGTSPLPSKLVGPYLLLLSPILSTSHGSLSVKPLTSLTTLTFTLRLRP